jgi:GNAT superfamily N-acetyltransferase
VSVTSAPIEIQYLAEYPELIPLLAAWFHAEFGRRSPDLSVERIERRLHERLNRDRIPFTLVGFLNQRPVASTSLKIRDMDTQPQYRHWLSTVYVQPDYRGQGIGSYLIEYTVREAARLGAEILYLYTSDRERLYSRLGWIVTDRVEYHGRSVVIMKRALKNSTMLD